MDAVVFDIETVPVNEDSFDDRDWEYILKYAESEEDEEKEKEKLSFWAFTAHLVSVTLLDIPTGRALVMYLSNREGLEELDRDGFTVYMKSFSIEGGIEHAERRILENFWKKVDERRNQRLVSFNGRRFDSVFLMLRSFVLDVRVSRDLIGKRFSYDNHLDLLDALTFHGQGRKYSLDFVCRRLGLPSPKESMDGHEVKRYFREGRYRDIALYNLKDTIATAEIYRRFYDTLGHIFGL